MRIQQLPKQTKTALTELIFQLGITAFKNIYIQKPPQKGKFKGRSGNECLMGMAFQFGVIKKIWNKIVMFVNTVNIFNVTELYTLK